jgi:agmatine/peptidylarginine deiminase
VSTANSTYLVDANFHDYTYSSYDSKGKKLRPLSAWIPFLSTEQDDDAPGAVAEYLDLDRQEVSIALTGGSVMFDGQGTLFIHRVVIHENEYLGHTFEEFKDQLASSFGVRRLIVLPNYGSWGLQHIDCILKLLDENRLLVKRLDPSHPDHERVELIVEELSNLETLDGRKYEILRIDTPNYFKQRSAPYTNALIFNDKIFVPLMGIPGDDEALETWQAAMPDYEVIGYLKEGGMSSWNYTDALHCRTKSIYLPGDLP